MDWSNRNFNKAVDSVVNAGCDSSCKSGILCPIATDNYGDQSNCNQIAKQSIRKGHNQRLLAKYKLPVSNKGNNNDKKIVKQAPGKFMKQMLFRRPSEL